jgi:hypothetical protein
VPVDAPVVAAPRDDHLDEAGLGKHALAELLEACRGRFLMMSRRAAREGRPVELEDRTPGGWSRTRGGPGE